MKWNIATTQRNPAHVSRVFYVRLFYLPLAMQRL
jgi:hypothetical protein